MSTANDVKRVLVSVNSLPIVASADITFVSTAKMVRTIVSSQGVPGPVGPAGPAIPATQVGEVLFSSDGSTFQAHMPLTSLTSGWLLDGVGIFLVVG